MLDLEVIRGLISDFHAAWVPDYSRREIQVDLLPGKISSIFGPRRAGKTYLLYLSGKFLCLLERGLGRERELPSEGRIGSDGARLGCVSVLWQIRFWF